ncbi:lactoylglutathione lyase, partial [Vibrio parahaemolyticus SBR10290]
TCLCWLR